MLLTAFVPNYLRQTPHRFKLLEVEAKKVPVSFMHDYAHVYQELDMAMRTLVTPLPTRVHEVDVPSSAA